MAFFCFKCGAEFLLSKPTGVGRTESCHKCNSDMHVCRNCKFYDKASYNECREPQADRVLEKERSNFCDYFAFIEGARGAGPKKDDHLKKLDDLFKK